MAFVFEKPRWSDEINDNQHLGPGTYDLKLGTKKQRFGYISPERNIVKHIKSCEKQIEFQQSAKQKISDEKRQAIRIMYLKNKIKRKVKKVVQVQKQNMELFKGFVKAKDKTQKIHSDQGYKDMKTSQRKRQLYKIINKEKSIPSLCKDWHEGLCINNKENTRLAHRSSSVNKINFRYYNENILKKIQEQDEKIYNDLAIGQHHYIQIKNGRKSQRGAIKTAQTKSRQYQKKIEIVKQLCNAYDQKPTGIQDDSQNSIQYIENSTPGPGSYHPYQNSQKPAKFIGNFGVTVSRFPNEKTNIYKNNLNVKIPNFKKESKASQQTVAFGTSTTNKQNQQINNKPITYLEDYNSIENKSLKHLMRNYHYPGFFLSKNERFEKKKHLNYYGPDFYISQDPTRLQQFKYLMKPQCSFLSKVQRLQPVNQLTSEVNFTGQQFNTIKSNIIEYPQIDRQPIAFLTDEPRFKEPQISNDIYLINNLKPQTTKQVIKGFTFRKEEETKNKLLNQTPFMDYQVRKSWIKQSFNVKFQAFDLI